jgi:hypothetical protein
MKRFGLYNDPVLDIVCIDEYEDGDYVKYEDAEKELATLRAENEKLKAKNIEQRKVLNGLNRVATRSREDREKLKSTLTRICLDIENGDAPLGDTWWWDVGTTVFEELQIVLAKVQP